MPKSKKTTRIGNLLLLNHKKVQFYVKNKKKSKVSAGGFSVSVTE